MELIAIALLALGAWWLNSYAAELRERRMAERLERMRQRMSASEAAGGAVAEIDAAIARSQIEAERAREFARRGGHW
jgi:ribosomal protein L12E/L44/L45/RPP1/RPP2